VRKLVPIALFLVIAAACSAGDSVVATVGGVDILQEDVTALRTTYTDTALGSDFRQDLSVIIFQEVVTQALNEQFGETVSAADIEAAAQERLDAVAASGGSIADFYSIEGATEELVRRDAISAVLLVSLSDALFTDPALAEALLTDRPEVVTQVCVRHVLVETETQALDVKNRLDSGEALADVAAEVSLDGGTPGGDLGCSLATRYVLEFADASLVAPIGEAFGPVETEFGFHILVVDERTTPTLEDIQADPTLFIPAETMQGERTTWINAAIREAAITVAPDVGEWDPDGVGIAPPAS